MPEHETIALEQDLAWREKAMWLLLRRLGGEVRISSEEWESVPPLPELVISREGDVMVWTARERSDEDEAARPSVTVDLNVRVRKHETYSGFEDVTGADPSSLRWGDRILAVEAESRICAEAIVIAVDAERQLVYLVPDWHGWRDMEPASSVAAELDPPETDVPLPFPEEP